MATADLATLVRQLEARLAAVETKLGMGAVATDDELAPLAKAFDAAVSAHLQKFEAAAAAVGGDAVVVAQTVRSQYDFVRTVLDMAAKCKKPTKEGLTELQKKLVGLAKPVMDIKAKTPKETANHVAGAVEGASAFMWPLADGGGVDIVQGGIEASEFWLNKVRVANKDVPAHKDFANSYRDGLKAQQEFVKENAKMGLVWNNAKGKDVAQYAAPGGGAPAAAAAAPAAGGAGATAAAPAPSPAPAPAAPASATPSTAKEPAALQSALFAQLGSIDQSSGRTAGLRHVTKDMKASANKDAPPAPAAAGKAATTPAGGAGAASKQLNTGAGKAITMGEPRIALVDQRMIVEFQDGLGPTGIKEPITLKDGLSLKQEVYIYGCRKVAIIVDAKVKGVRVDQCAEVTLLVDSALSGIEVVNSRKMKVQVKNKLPSVAIDKTDGILVGLPWGSRDAQIVTSKSSEMNVTFPTSDKEDADWVEHPIPEQFVTKITPEGRLVTTMSELYTA